MSRLFMCALFLLLAVAACRRAEPPSAAATTSTVAPVEAPVEAPPAAPVATSETAIEPTGAYFAMDELPAEFADLDHLLLATIDENAAPAPLNGFVRPKKAEAQDYALVRPVLAGRNLTFTTTAVDGVHYAFDGAFEVLGNFAENPPSYETAVLTGTLKKLRDGKSIASTPVRFRYEAGG